MTTPAFVADVSIHSTGGFNHCRNPVSFQIRTGIVNVAIAEYIRPLPLFSGSSIADVTQRIEYILANIVGCSQKNGGSNRGKIECAIADTDKAFRKSNSSSQEITQIECAIADTDKRIRKSNAPNVASPECIITDTGKAFRAC